ncbi:MAG: flagellar basal body-associated FliL family protein [Sphingomonadaceae bacterium]
MAEAPLAPGLPTSETTDVSPKKGRIGKILIPLLLVAGGAVAGIAAAIFVPPYLPASVSPIGTADAALPKKPPVVAPLQYVEIDNVFTANLRDSGRYVQLKVAISTHGGAPVVEAVERHKIAIIAAVLSVLADASGADLDAPGGRDGLAREMRLAINDLLQRKSGLAGVDDVFLTSFIVQ